jgi:formate/nitrite transporter FocA (FNT family)
MADILDERGEPLGPAGLVAPDLSEEEQKEARERTSISAPVVHEAIRRDGEEELQRPVSALAWSGLAAGLSMGFSFVTEGLLHHYLPATEWQPLVVSIGYPFGFLLIIIGRQQLFTENTLTAVIPLLARRNLVTLVSVLRLWAVVLAANLVGAHLFAWVLANTPMFPPEFQPGFHAIATQAADVSFWTAILRGVFAGWLIAMVVWMLAAVDSGRIAIIVILTYVVGLAGLTHIIAGSVEVLYLVMADERNWFAYLGGYMVPTLIGNILGGVALVSALNHAQVVSGRPRRRTPSKAGRTEPA